MPRAKIKVHRHVCVAFVCGICVWQVWRVCMCVAGVASVCGCVCVCVWDLGTSNLRSEI